MAEFETLNALRDLDDRTPEYLCQEVWAHGDSMTVRVAHQILNSGLDPGERSGYTLRALLRLIPEGEGRNAG